MVCKTTCASFFFLSTRLPSRPHTHANKTTARAMADAEPDVDEARHLVTGEQKAGVGGGCTLPSRRADHN